MPNTLTLTQLRRFFQCNHLTVIRRELDFLRIPYSETSDGKILVLEEDLKKPFTTRSSITTTTWQPKV